MFLLLQTSDALRSKVCLSDTNSVLRSLIIPEILVQEHCCNRRYYTCNNRFCTKAFVVRLQQPLAVTGGKINHFFDFSTRN